MKNAVNNERRARKQIRAGIDASAQALAESRKFAVTGQFAKATRAAQLAERHASLARQLVGLEAALKRIAAARHHALAAIASALASAEAKLTPPSCFALGPETDPADDTRNWSIRDPRVQALFKKAMEKEETTGG